jgi:hypothetical protein
MSKPTHLSTLAILGQGCILTCSVNANQLIDHLRPNSILTLLGRSCISTILCKAMCISAAGATNNHSSFLSNGPRIPRDSCSNHKCDVRKQRRSEERLWGTARREILQNPSIQSPSLESSCMALHVQGESSPRNLVPDGWI